MKILFERTAAKESLAFNFNENKIIFVLKLLAGNEWIQLQQNVLQKAGKALDMLPVYHRANTD